MTSYNSSQNERRRGEGDDPRHQLSAVARNFAGEGRAIMSTAQTCPDGLVTAVACPFRYPNGRACTGHVVRVDLHAAMVVWLPREDGEWVCELSPSSRYRVYCSEKGTHAAVRRQMSFYLSNLPPALKQVILSARVTWPGHRSLASG